MGKNAKKDIDRIKPSVNLSLRVALRLPEFEGSRSLDSLRGIQVIFYVDEAFESSLIELLQDRTILKKFKFVIDLIRSNKMNRDVYGSEKNSDKSKDVYAIKIRVKGNHRIYCKEFGFPGVRRIVLIRHVHKKKDNFNRELRSLVDTIGEYRYEFEES